MLRAARLLATLMILALAGLWGHAWYVRAPGEAVSTALGRTLAGLLPATVTAPAAGGVQLPEGANLGGPFALTDQDGRAVTERDFAGRWLLVYFGYTFCPDVCPTELGAVAAALDAMGPAGERVTPLFVTIDPARDTPARLAEYVPAFHPRLVGLTGTEEQVAAAARAYRVYHARARGSAETDYLVDHSGFVYLAGPDGTVRTVFRPGTAPAAIAAAVSARLARS